jgi:N-acetylglutamate synthase-like GNAT family acetyltransferase
MSLKWHRDLPVWNSDKARILGAVPVGVLDTRYAEMTEGAQVPCDWFRVEEEGKTVGYGWIDVVWGDAEILLATAPDAKKAGVGAFILQQLDREARRMGLNYIYNVVRPTHPAGDDVIAWLTKNGFESKPDGRLTRRVGHSL